MRRRRNTTEAGCPGEDRLETEETQGAPDMGSVKGGNGRTRCLRVKGSGYPLNRRLPDGTGACGAGGDRGDSAPYPIQYPFTGKRGVSPVSPNHFSIFSDGFTSSSGSPNVISYFPPFGGSAPLP